MSSITFHPVAHSTVYASCKYCVYMSSSVIRHSYPFSVSRTIWSSTESFCIVVTESSGGGGHAYFPVPSLHVALLLLLPSYYKHHSV